jgi:hypothetical protein
MLPAAVRLRLGRGLVLVIGLGWLSRKFIIENLWRAKFLVEIIRNLQRVLIHRVFLMNFLAFRERVPFLSLHLGQSFRDLLNRRVVSERLKPSIPISRVILISRRRAHV